MTVEPCAVCGEPILKRHESQLVYEQRAGVESEKKAHVECYARVTDRMGDIR